MSDEDNTPAEVGFTAVPPTPLDVEFPDEPPPAPDPTEEVLPPTPVVLRIEGGFGPGRSWMVMAALTADGLWLQDT
jgi:hypothetical protein